MNDPQLKRRRLKLWNLSPYCTFCGCLTVLPPEKSVSHSIPPENQATIEHLKSRLDPTRQNIKLPGEERTVLACWRCNNDRNKEEQARIGAEKLRARALAGKEIIKPEHPKAALIRQAWKESGTEFKILRKKTAVRRATIAFMKDEIDYLEFVKTIKVSL